ncbi:EI24 domain-containing protein [Sphaerotilus sp.]|uniref:EI24 domain-containing protein n=1 Tax=Sphaerotilus sp. TaxID=2093942 RepID=UPI002ACEEA99|nr:EI24 domain-containing protein [Sphaerotilus sp.]MDZ7857408.1 EI24 domain-containing protein [Sphaerotilus sp.]
MSKVLDAFWRALGYCLLPRVIFLSLLPVLLLGSLAFGLAWFFWEPAIEGVRQFMLDTPLLAPVTEWIDQFTGGVFRNVIGPLIVVVLAVPVMIVASLLLVSVFMGSTVVNLVARRRFEMLERQHGGRWWQALWWSLGSTVFALAVLVVSLPLWVIPPLALLVPPLVWGWLTYRVMVYDALADHATHDERLAVMRRHRTPLLVIGIVSGYLGAAPSLIWAMGALALPMMPLLIPVFVWLYTLVFVLAALWFTHYGLAALDELRREQAVEVLPPVVTPAPAAPALPGGPTAGSGSVPDSIPPIALP